MILVHAQRSAARQRAAMASFNRFSSKSAMKVNSMCLQKYRHMRCRCRFKLASMCLQKKQTETNEMLLICAGNNNDDYGKCSTKCRKAACGDGIIQSALGEQCDDGQKNSQTGSCSTDCLRGKCGDGIVQPLEECDEGKSNSDSGKCTTLCKKARCGDGLVQAGEECDNSSESCIKCKLAACGDGIVQSGEECDDGVNNGKAGHCTSACKVASCGDGEMLISSAKNVEAHLSVHCHDPLFALSFLHQVWFKKKSARNATKGN